MARIVADRGIQFYQNPGGGTGVRYHEFDLDCSCTLRVTDYYLANLSGRNDLMTSLERVADAHICEIEVFMVHTEAAQRARTRAAQAQRARPLTAQEIVDRSSQSGALTYMGIDLGRSDDRSAWLANWQREMIGTFAPRRRTPAEVERSVRENPAPRQDIEAEVRRAATQVRGASVTSVIVDEVGPAPRVAPGAVAVELARREAPKDQPRPDRFDLIEID